MNWNTFRKLAKETETISMQPDQLGDLLKMPVNQRIPAPVYAKLTDPILSDQQASIRDTLRAMALGHVYEASRLARSTPMPGIAEEHLRVNMFAAIDQYVRDIWSQTAIPTPAHLHAQQLADNVERLAVISPSIGDPVSEPAT